MVRGERKDEQMGLSLAFCGGYCRDPFLEVLLGLHWVNIGIMEKKMETTIWFRL